MNVCVMGMWHLGTVTAACLASRGHDVIGLDLDEMRVARLNDGRPPLFEPGLEPLVREGLASGRLHFSSDAASALSGREVLWICYDTPIDDEDCADVESVVAAAKHAMAFVASSTLVLVSSQLPVGTTNRLETECRSLRPDAAIEFAYSPENLRLGKAIETFNSPDRIVVGVNSEPARRRAGRLLTSITDRIEWMSVESAEMTKHALNAFLGTSICFINEVATLCERVGADAADVARGLRTDSRIGPGAYLLPGNAFAGGTIAREVVFMDGLGRHLGLPMHLTGSILESNRAHRLWAAHRLVQTLGALSGQSVAVWGLTYKPGTDTLRRSASIELCASLAARGARVRVHDPSVVEVPESLPQGCEFFRTPDDALSGATALVIATPWPEYRHVKAERIVSAMERALVLDAGRHLAETAGKDSRIEYITVGRGLR